MGYNYNMYYTYVLMCVDHKLYVGYSSDLKQRIDRHQKGEVFATKGRRPLKLIFYEAFLSSADAKRREKYFKTSPGRKALKIMLRETLK